LLLSSTDRAAMRAAAAQAIDRFTAIGDRWGELNPRMQLALDAEQHGDTTVAAEHYERCLDIARDLGFASYEAMFVTHLGRLAVLAGDLDRAEALHEQAVATFTRVGSPAGAAFARSALADLAVRRGDVAKARTMYEEILAYYRHAGIEDQVAPTLTRLGYLAQRDGNLTQAHTCHLESLQVAADLRHPAATASALEGLASVAVADGDADRAARLLGGAAALRERADVPVPEADSADVRQALERTRAVLNGDAFQAAFQAGGDLSLPQLVDLARATRGADA
jgi:tetratricopeptide (TPR) repeat protein